MFVMNVYEKFYIFRRLIMYLPLMEEICVSHARRGRPATYRQAYYHHSCLEKIKGERRVK